MELGLKTWGRAGAKLRAFLERHWRKALRVRERVRISEGAYHLMLAGGVGVIGGLANLFFYLLIECVQGLVFAQEGDPVEVAEVLAWWQRAAAPVLGGLAAGLVLYWGLRFLGTQRPGNLLEVVQVGDGRLPFRSSMVKTASAALSIGTGASIGREGAVVHLAATLASKLGQLGQGHPYRLRLLVACGAASGIAAAYNAPIAGAVFAAQIVLGNFSMNLFAPVVFASVVASMLSRTFFGIETWYVVPPFDFTSVAQLPWFLVLGLLCGLLGAAFLKLLQLSEAIFQRVRLPSYACVGLGGLAVGLIALAYPEVWGNGYTVTNRILEGRYTLEILIGVFLAKLLATTITVGSGTVGGVFTPTLFLGAALGSAFGTLLHLGGLAVPLPTAAFALVGMGSVLAGTTHSPLLAMIMVFEISLNYSLMPPLMIACVVASLVARRLHPASVYTEPLRRKGLALEGESARTGAAMEQTVGDLMRDPVPPLRETTPLQEVTTRFLTSSNNFLPVVDGNQRFLGLVALHDLKEYLGSGQEVRGVIAYDVMRPPPPCLTPNQRLTDALPLLLASEQRNVPVVNNLTENRLVGTVQRAEALGLLSEAIAPGGAPQS